MKHSAAYKCKINKHRGSIYTRKEGRLTHQVKIKPFIIIFTELVKPDLSQANRVLFHNINASFPRIWAAFTENMAHVTTGHNFQSTATHPDLQVARKLDYITKQVLLLFIKS